MATLVRRQARVQSISEIASCGGDDGGTSADASGLMAHIARDKGTRSRRISDLVAVGRRPRANQTARRITARIRFDALDGNYRPSRSACSATYGQTYRSRASARQGRK